ncbi:hypothetical protein KEJ26_01810 [Candidatus Bathyarchaeota archaeon]|nr:hypothetical protein [Candidatus Bathyarchaeota archaeon]
MVQAVLLLTIFLAAGISLKIADITGERTNGVLSYLLAGISGVLFGILIAESKISSAIMFGIIVGVTASAKVDKPNLAFGLFIAIITAIKCGLVIPTIWLFLVVATFAFADELGHKRYRKLKGPLKWFFQYRCALKVTMVFLAIIAVLPPVYCVGFFLFDAGYEATSALIRRLGPMPRFK